MPELPEVEGLRRRLAPHLIGKRVAFLDVRDAKLWHPAEGLTAEAVAGRTVLGVARHAKLVAICLEGELTLLLHLKIAGQIAWRLAGGERLLGGHPYPAPEAELPGASTRFVLAFDGGPLVYVNDQRRFAWLRLAPTPAIREYIELAQYGPDPLDPSFTSAVLAARLAARKRRPIKAALLDQTCIAGLGNIYVDESLHRARLHPMTRAGDLDQQDVSRLHQAIGQVLDVAVPVGGALVKVGRALPDAASGRDFLRAHGRAGQPCLDCVARRQSAASGDSSDSGDSSESGQARIVRAFLAGRGTYFCPVCQPAPAGVVMPPDAELLSDRSVVPQRERDLGTIECDVAILRRAAGRRSRLATRDHGGGGNAHKATEPEGKP